MGHPNREEYVSCQHKLEPWRKGKYEANGQHGPERSKDYEGTVMLRSFTFCRNCGGRFERVELERTKRRAKIP